MEAMKKEIRATLSLFDVPENAMTLVEKSIDWHAKKQADKVATENQEKQKLASIKDIKDYCYTELVNLKNTDPKLYEEVIKKGKKNNERI